jgi:hypothetical protein
MKPTDMQHSKYEKRRKVALWDVTVCTLEVSHSDVITFCSHNTCAFGAETLFARLLVYRSHLVNLSSYISWCVSRQTPGNFYNAAATKNKYHVVNKAMATYKNICPVINTLDKIQDVCRPEEAVTFDEAICPLPMYGYLFCV